jgi:hypothetical protein
MPSSSQPPPLGSPELRPPLHQPPYVAFLPALPHSRCPTGRPSRAPSNLCPGESDASRLRPCNRLRTPAVLDPIPGRSAPAGRLITLRPAGLDDVRARPAHVCPLAPALPAPRPGREAPRPGRPAGARRPAVLGRCAGRLHSAGGTRVQGPVCGTVQAGPQAFRGGMPYNRSCRSGRWARQLRRPTQGSNPAEHGGSATSTPRRGRRDDGVSMRVD